MKELRDLKDLTIHDVQVVGLADSGIDVDHCFFKDRARAVPFDKVSFILLVYSGSFPPDS